MVDGKLARDIARVWLDLPALGAFLRIPNVKPDEPGITDFGYRRWTPIQRAFEQRRTGRDFVLKPRQSFFSTVEIARDVQYALTHDGVQVLIVCDDRKEKDKFFLRVKLMVSSLAKWGLVPTIAKYDTRTEIVWEHNDSGIYITEAGASVGAASSTGRSGTVHRAHLTETAFWKSPEAAWTSLEGAMEHGDEVVIESTANGADTWHHKMWLDVVAGKFGGITPHFFPWFDHPGRAVEPHLFPDSPTTSRERRWEEILVDELGITPAQLAWWRGKVQTLRLDKALQEYPPTAEAAFQSAGDTWIEPEHLDELGRHVRAPLRLHKVKRGELRIFEEPVKGVPYVAAGDVSDGVGLDEASIVVLKHRTGEVVAAWDDKWTKPKEYARVLAEVGALYNKALLAPERDGMRLGGGDAIGTVVVKALLDSSYPKHRIYRCPETKKHGWSTNKRTRPVLLGDMADAIEKGEVTMPDRKTVAETRALVNRGGRVRARGKHSSGGDDGLFFAWAIGYQVMDRARIPGRSRITLVGTLDVADFRT